MIKTRNGNKLIGNDSKILRYSSIGLEMGVATAIGYFIGHYLDGRFDTDPWLTIIFTLFGVAAGFKNIIKLTLEELRKGDAGDDEEREQP